MMARATRKIKGVIGQLLLSVGSQDEHIDVRVGIAST